MQTLSLLDSGCWRSGCSEPLPEVLLFAIMDSHFNFGSVVAEARRFFVAFFSKSCIAYI